MTVETRQPLTRQRILQTALELVDAEGLAALSMRRLGQELGVEAMSLYHHVPSKEALVAGVVETAMANLEMPEGGQGDWRTRIEALAHAYRRLAHAHPHVFPIMANGAYQTEETRRLFDAMVEICHGAHFSATETQDAFCTIGSYISGFILFELGGIFTLPFQDEPLPPGNGLSHYPVADLIPRTPAEHDAQFALGLEIILTGLVAREASVTTTSP